MIPTLEEPRGGDPKRIILGSSEAALWGTRALAGRSGSQFCFLLGSPPCHAAPQQFFSPSTLFLGLSFPKFSWQETQRQLPLIGCVLLLISLVISLILLCELNRGHGVALGHCKMEWRQARSHIPQAQRDSLPHGDLGSWGIRLL